MKKVITLIRLIIATVKIICRNMVWSVIRVPYGAFYCIVLLRNRSTHYVVICDHIGDFLITMGYLEAYRKEKELKHITICTTQKFVPFLLDNKFLFDDNLVLNSKRLYRILMLSSTNFGDHIVKKLGNLTIINPTNAFTEEGFVYLARFPHVTFGDCIKYGCLELQKDSEHRPLVIKTEQLVSPEVYPKGRTVLLCPFARTTKLNAMPLFAVIAEKLIAEGFIVLTNIAIESDPVVAGTVGIHCSLHEVFQLVEHGGFVVGTRSGILDWLMYAECKMVAIYSEADIYFDFFDLLSLPQTKADVMQFRQQSYGVENVNNIISFFTEERQNEC